MTQSNNNLIALSAPNNTLAVVADDLFRDIDFSGITTAIDKIGDHNTGMTPEEKEMANEIVGQWQKDVVGRLKQKGYDMNRFINFFEVQTGTLVNDSTQLEDIGADLADKTGTINEYDALIGLLDEIEELHQDRPQVPVEREERTYAERLEEEKNYQRDSALYKVKETRLLREIYIAEKAWKKLLKQNKEVKELLKKAKSYTKNVDTFQQNCHDKAQVAKLNITVSNKDVRESLRELLDFTTTV